MGSAKPAATLAGVALHAGVPACVTLRRSAGPIRFVQRGAAATLDELSAVRTDRGVCLATEDGRVRIDLAEHLLGALGGLGVRAGLTIETYDPELPLLDGGARRFVEALRAIGLGVGPPEPPRLAVGARGQLSDGRSTYRFVPGAGVELRVEVDFRAPVGREDAEWVGDADDFARRIAPARTFGWLDEAEALRAAGRARYVDPAAVVVLGAEAGAPAPRGEAARHKLLDLAGDLALYGGPPRGRIEAFAPGHGATHRIVAEALRRGLLVRRP